MLSNNGTRILFAGETFASTLQFHGDIIGAFINWTSLRSRLFFFVPTGFRVRCFPSCRVMSSQRQL